MAPGEGPLKIGRGFSPAEVTSMDFERRPGDRVALSEVERRVKSALKRAVEGRERQ